MRLSQSDIVITADDRPGVHRTPRQISAPKREAQPAAKAKAKPKRCTTITKRKPKRRNTQAGTGASKWRRSWRSRNRSS